MARSSAHTKELTQVKKELESLYKTVYQGNGSPSLVSQVSKLESKINSLETMLEHKLEALESEMGLKFKNITEVVTEKFANISSQIATEFTKKSVSSQSQWSFRTAITTSIIASATSLLVLLLSEFLKRG